MQLPNKNVALIWARIVCTRSLLHLISLHLLMFYCFERLDLGCVRFLHLACQAYHLMRDNVRVWKHTFGLSHGTRAEPPVLQRSLYINVPEHVLVPEIICRHVPSDAGLSSMELAYTIALDALVCIQNWSPSPPPPPPCRTRQRNAKSLHLALILFQCAAVFFQCTS